VDAERCSAQRLAANPAAKVEPGPARHFQLLDDEMRIVGLDDPPCLLAVAANTRYSRRSSDTRSASAGGGSSFDDQSDCVGFRTWKRSWRMEEERSWALKQD